MQGSNPQTFHLAEVLKWRDDGELELNPKFQRGAVWSSPAQSYLINSILNGYPIPKIMMRTAVDRDSRRTLRDVVDGQQRLRTIIDFASNRLTLTSKAAEYSGLKYSDLEPEDKDNFLGYKVTIEQLLNASDEDVLEVFLRLNSYTVQVSDAELRNAKYETAFSDLVKSLAIDLRHIWELGVLTPRERVRMLDQSIVAEVLGFNLEGVTDGGEARITRLYENYKNADSGELPDQALIFEAFAIAGTLIEPIAKSPLTQRPHFLMLVAAVLRKMDALPEGNFSIAGLPAPARMNAPLELVQEALIRLNTAIVDDDEDPPEEIAVFMASRTTMQRRRSRQPRLEFFARALAGQLAIQRP